MNKASSTSAPAIMKNTESMLRNDSARSSGVIAVPLATAKMPPTRMTPDTRWGASHVPTELKVCEKVRRKCARAGGPRAAASGFATTCRMVMPLAITNSATSTSE
jgi:hypothetical protein